MKKIILNDSVYSLCVDYPFLKSVLISIGYFKLNSKIYFNIFSKRILLDDALAKENITLNQLNNALKKYNYVATKPNPINIDRIKFLKSVLINLIQTKDYQKAKSDFIAHLDKVEAYEFGMAINELLSSVFTVQELKATFYLRKLLLENNLKDSIDSLTNEVKELFDFIKYNNAKIKTQLDKLSVYADKKDRVVMLQTLYFDLTKYFVFKENYLLKSLKSAGNEEPFKIISSVDKSVLDLIKEQIKSTPIENKQLTINIDHICNMIKDLIFADEYILIYLINIFIRKKIILKINKKIKSKNIVS